MTIARRSLIKLAGTGLVASALPTAASAQTKPRIAVTIYAGDFEKGMREDFLPLLDAGKIQVDWVLGAAQQWTAQVEASQQSPPLDVLLVSPTLMVDGIKKGLYEKISVEKVPNLKDVPPVFIDTVEGYGLVFDWGTHAFTYHKGRMKQPPKSIKEFVEGTIAGKWHAGLPGIGYSFLPTVLIWRFNQALGGTIDNITPVIDAMKAMKPNLTVWNTLPDFTNQLQSGDVDIGYYPSGRSWTFHDSGADWIGVALPSEGAIINSVVAVKPKNAKPQAWDFINALLDPKAQAKFADRLSYGMSNKNVVYPDRVKDRIPDWQTAVDPPVAEIAARTPAWIERWNKEVGL